MVTDLTLGVDQQYGFPGRNKPFEQIARWSEHFGKARNITLESRRDYGHGLFSFAEPFNTFRLLHSKEPTISSNMLEFIPDNWDSGPSREVVIDADAGRPFTEGELKKIARFAERR